MNRSSFLPWFICLALAACERGGNVEEIRMLAEAGDLEAQNHLGRMYDTGEGVPKDAARAFGWYMKAAKQGLGIAQYNLGGMYYEGSGALKSKAEAAQWFEAAAQQGITQAQIKLGFMYWQGDGVEKDLQRAKAWFEHASQSGDGIARTALAQLKRE